MVKMANPSAENSAAALPVIRPSEIPSMTMMATPSIAIKVAIQVALRTFSLSSTQPSIAAKKGADANKNIALATVVV